MRCDAHLRGMLISLTGYMCSGKSRVGRALSQRSSLPFHDLDRLVEQAIGGPITPFFLREGEAAFRAVEADVLLHTLKHARGVLATGGGSLLDPEMMAHAQRVGTVVYLDVPYEVLVQRILRAGRDRPLYFGADEAEVRSRTGSLLAERAEAYARATIHVNADGAPEEVVDRILAALGPLQEM